MYQELMIAAIFLFALGYLGRMLYKSFQAKKSCATGCGKCGVVDFEKIEKQIEQKLPQA